MMKFYKRPFLPIITLLGRQKARKHFTEEPIFIGGCGRSGTTVLLSIISAHSDVFACPKELALFHKMSRNSKGQLKLTRIDRLYRAILSNKIKGTANRFSEKSPSNVKYIDAIDEYFNGKFKFIHIIRDGRDVVLSIHPTDKNKYWVDPKRWVNDVKTGLEYVNHPNVITIFYEDLMQNYTETISKICKACELELTNEILNWFEHTTVKKNRAYHSGVSKIHNSSIAKWKKDENKARVAEFMNYPKVEELMKKLGYLDGKPSLDGLLSN